MVTPAIDSQIMPKAIQFGGLTGRQTVPELQGTSTFGAEKPKAAGLGEELAGIRSAASQAPSGHFAPKDVIGLKGATMDLGHW